MGLRLGDEAPDFTAESSQGTINFHEWLGDSWGVLFSHPKDFTPVCTTELGYVAKIEPEFAKRGVKVIGLSVDSTGDHERWADDIEETQGARPAYPIIGKFTAVPWVSSMSLSHSRWLSTGSTDRPITLTPRLSNSGFSRATAPSSVVQTGVKSLGCEKRMAHPSPIH